MFSPLVNSELFILETGRSHCVFEWMFYKSEDFITTGLRPLTLHAFNWGASCENVSSSLCGPQRPRPACASAQSDQGLCCSQTESLDTVDSIEYFNGEQCPDETAHVEDDVNPHILRMLKDTFSLDASSSFFRQYKYDALKGGSCLLFLQGRHLLDCLPSCT